MSMGNKECERMLRRAMLNVCMAGAELRGFEFAKALERLKWIESDLQFIATTEEINGTP